MEEIQSQPKRHGRAFFLVCLLAAVILGSLFVLRSSEAEQSVPEPVEVRDKMTRSEVASLIGDALGWSKKEKESFASVYAQMQWAAWNTELERIFAKKLNWKEAEREAFITNSARYFHEEYDFLSPATASSTYVLSADMTAAGVADLLISKSAEASKGNIETYLASRLDEDAAQKVAVLVRNEVELLPDLVPFPPLDLHLERKGEKVLLSFTTSYYNKGKGPLELRADEKTKGIRRDIERNVYQRVLREDGGFRDKLVGTFLWHQPHLHYHFADFVTYDLEAVKVKSNEDLSELLSGVRMKSTFCIRDVSLITMDLEKRAKDAGYLICGKEKQGISVGWADTYFYTYVDQNLDLAGLPSGRYRLSFNVNPAHRIDEMDLSNNKSSVLIDIDMKKLTVKVVETEPKDPPAIEHKYYEQVFDN